MSQVAGSQYLSMSFNNFKKRFEKIYLFKRNSCFNGDIKDSTQFGQFKETVSRGNNPLEKNTNNSDMQHLTEFLITYKLRQPYFSLMNVVVDVGENYIIQ